MVEVGEVKGSKVPVTYYRKNEDDIRANTVKGIEYATVGYKYAGNFKNRDRREYRKTNDVSDISGCAANTLFKGIKLRNNLRRLTNPL